MDTQKHQLMQLLTRGYSKHSEPIPTIKGHTQGLSKAQLRLWYFEKLFPNTATYNMYSALRLTGEPDKTAIEYSMNQLIKRHELLRTRFYEQDGQVFQEIISNPPPVHIQSIRLDDTTEDGLQRQLHSLSQLVFDLDSPTLLKVYWLEINPFESVLLVVMHHLISDGWSLGIFFKEFSQLYHAYTEQRPSPLEPTTIRYIDYVAWQQEQCSSEKQQQELAYWKTILDESILPLHLGGMKKIPTADLQLGKRHYFSIPSHLVATLKAELPVHQVTLFMICLTAFYILLYRHSLQRDLVIGTPIANRKHPDFECLIGFFVNTLALRLQIDGTPTFAELLKQVRQVAHGAYGHQDLPFEETVKALHPQRDLSSSPLFNMMFVFQNTPFDTLSLPNLQLDWLPTHNGTAKFDLLLSLIEQPGELLAYVEYRTHVFDDDFIQQFSNQYLVLLEEIGKNFNRPIDEYSLLSAKEKTDWLANISIQPITTSFQSVITSFEQRAQLEPAGLALIHDDHTITYHELNRRANQLGHHLMSLGGLPGALIGLTMSPSIDLIVSIIATLKVGAAYVPLDPNYPPARLQLMIDDTQLGVIITTSAFAPMFNEFQGHCIAIDHIQETLGSYPDTNPNIAIAPNRLAYIIYTSGSTGTPKGVLVQHQHIARLFSATQAWYQFSPSDKGCLFHSYSFDVSVWEMWSTLCYGGCLYLLNDLTKKSPEEFYDFLLEHQITLLNQTPSAFYQLLALDLSNKPKLSRLRLVVFAGEKLDIYRLSPWFKCYGDEKPSLVNMYGTTETTVHAMYRPIQLEDLSEKTSPLGCPIPDLQIYLLDPYQQPVPVGVVGELYIGGEGVTAGYLNRDELTQERFIHYQPSEKHRQIRLYKTGDLARYHIDGELEYIGRSDNQVKIRGYRIELGEIEQAIQSHPGVKQTVVIAQQAEILEKKLIAYVVFDKNRWLECHHDSEQTNQINDWQTVFNHCYTDETELSDPAFNIKGWVNSYTREPMPAEEMKQWVTNTVDAILCFHPQQVLEIGCGTGLLLSQIAPSCTRYIGTDLSEVAIDYVQKLKEQYQLRSVELLHRAADRFDAFEPRAFDTLILNSVCQYFPSHTYLQTVIAHGIECLMKGGRFWIGDVRHYELLHLLHTDLVISNISEQTTLHQLQYAIDTSLKQEMELNLSPQFFLNLKEQCPRISHVNIYYKNNWLENELTLFRYDVLLFLEADEPANNIQSVSWSDLTVIDIEQMLPNLKNGDILHIASIPNQKRLTLQHLFSSIKRTDLSFTTVQGLMHAMKHLNNEGIHPVTLSHIAKQANKIVKFIPSRCGKIWCFDALFMDTADSAAPLPMTLFQPSLDTEHRRQPHNTPMIARMEPIHIQHLHDDLRTRLPAYMVPNRIISLDSLPLTVNGKLDKQALPLPITQKIGLSLDIQPLQTETERKVASFFSQLLGVAAQNRQDDFFKLGGHSLLATRLILLLNQHFNKKIPLRLVLLKSTVSSLAEAIDAWQNDVSELDKTSSVDLSQEIQLDSKIIVNQPFSRPDTVDAIFVTGTTGFVGAFLLHQLLEKTTAVIHCLIRANHEADAFNRLTDTLQKYALWKAAYQQRINIVLGDLEKPCLGLTDSAFDTLCKEIDEIYHAAAIVNFIYPYSKLKESNVGGTEEILRLASRYKTKKVHHISTLYVFSHLDLQHTPQLDETLFPSCWEGLSLGYNQSKWVAEHLVKLGRERGIPINIYRLGRISGSSETGACQEQDFFWEVIRIGLTLQSMPNLDIRVNLTPVDYVSKAILALSNHMEENSNYHLLNQHTLPFQDLLNHLNTIGYRFERLSLENWKNKILQDVSAEDMNHPAYRLLPILASIDQENNDKLCFEHQITLQHLEATDIEPSSLSDLMTLYVDYFVDSGYFPMATDLGAISDDRR